MKLFSIYQWMSGTKADFLKTFSDNKNLRQEAEKFWSSLEATAPYLIIIFLILGIGCAVLYYTWYNNQPGRHYKPSHWLGWLGVCFISVLVVSIGVEFLLLNTNLPNTEIVISKVSLCNALYASVVYFLTSFICCNSVTTNAYKLFK